MYNLRIVPEGAPLTNFKAGHKKCLYKISDTIPCPSEWTAEEAVAILAMPKKKLDEIVREYNTFVTKFYLKLTVSNGQILPMSFAQYLSDLISLALSGLTVEEKLSEVKK